MSIGFPMTGVRVLASVAALAAVSVLGACGEVSREYVPGPSDYREAYPIRTQMRTFSVKVPMRAVLAEEARLPADFLNTYRRQGRGPMTIVLPDGAGSNGLRAARALGWWLDGQMIEAVAVRSAPGVPGSEGGDGDSLAVFFRGYVALVSECGDWSGETGFNPSNLPHTNFGCAYQRNIGMMLSDPGDLVDPRDLAPGSGYRASVVIGKWYNGQYTGAEQPPQERGTVTDVIGR